VNGYNHRLKYNKDGDIWTVTVYEDMDGKYEIASVIRSTTNIN